MSEWKEKLLSDLAVLHNNSWKIGDEECPYIALEHIDEGKLRLNGIGHSEIVNSNKYRFNEDNFLFGKLRPYFRKVVRPKFSGICSTDIWVIGSRNKTDLTFLFYLFANKEFVDLAYSGSSGTRMPRADWNFMKDTTWNVPVDAKEQKAIASVLSSLDDKIDLLHRQNKTLEDMAETLFRQSFIEEAEMGFEETELGNVVETTSGGTPSRKKMEYYENGIYHWVKSKELTGSFIFETEEKITDEALKNSSAKILPENSILIAMYGATVGEYTIISKEMTCNQAVCALKPNDQYPYTYLFMLIKTMKEELINMAVGSAQQNISQQLIKQLTILLPNNKIIEFHKKTEATFEKIKLNIKQIRSLEKLRDTLLPKLMSGEVRVEYEN